MDVFMLLQFPLLLASVSGNDLLERPCLPCNKQQLHKVAVGDDLSCLKPLDDGCAVQKNVETCLSSWDNRGISTFEDIRIKFQPCVWCGDGQCNSINANLCEPFEFSILNDHRTYGTYMAKGEYHVASCDKGELSSERLPSICCEDLKIGKLTLVFRNEEGKDIPVDFDYRPLQFRFSPDKMPLTVESVEGQAAEKGVKPGWDLMGVNSLAVDDAQTYDAAYLFFRKKALELPTREVKIAFLDQGEEKVVYFHRRPLEFDVDPNSNPLRVSDADSIAAAKGIKPGMIIKEVDEWKMVEFKGPEALNFLNGEAASLPARAIDMGSAPAQETTTTTAITQRVVFRPTSQPSKSGSSSLWLWILFLLLLLLILVAAWFFYFRKHESRFLELCEQEPLVKTPRGLVALAVTEKAVELPPELIVVFSDGKTGHTVHFYEKPLGFRLYHERYPVEVSSVTSREALSKGVAVGMNVIRVGNKYTANMPFQQLHDLLLAESAKLPQKTVQEVPHDLTLVFSDGKKDFPVTFHHRPLGIKLDHEKVPPQVSTVVDQVCIAKGVAADMQVIKVAEQPTNKMTFQELTELLLKESNKLPLKSE